MKSTPAGYCKKEILWPKKAYGIMVPLFRENEAFWLFTSYSLSVNLDQIRKLASEFNEELAEFQEGDINSGESVVIFEMELDRLINMSADMWSKKGLKYSDNDRNKLLMDAVKTPQFYEVLATYWGEPESPYAIAAAFYKNHDKDIDNFMKTTNWQVDTTAKTSAVYNIVKTFGYDWVHDEVLTANDQVSKLVN